MMTLRLFPAILLLFFAPLSALPAEADIDPNQLEVEHSLTTDFVTPHTRWAKPYAGGRIRVLAFYGVYQGSTHSREIIELIQRFDIDVAAVYFDTPSKRLQGDYNARWYAVDDAGSKRAMHLLQKPVDVFLFAYAKLADYPLPVQERVRDLVRQGAGLVLVGSSDSTLCAAATPLPLPPGVPASTCGYATGEGRTVLVPLRRQVPYEIGWETEFDYQMEQYGRALLWAADRLPQSGLTVQIAEVMDRTELANKNITVTWDRARPESNLQVCLRRQDGEKQIILKRPLRSASGALTLPLPALRADPYHADLFLTGSAGIENWSSSGFAVTSVQKIEKIVLQPDWSEVGGVLQGYAELAGPAGAAALEIRLLDRHNRILARQKATAQGKLYPFRFPVQEWLPMLVRVQAVLADREEQVCARHAFFHVTKRHRDQFNFVIWNWPGEDLAPYGLESMADCGATAILSGGNPPLSLAACDLAYVPYTTRICAQTHTVTGMLDQNGIMKGGCYNDDSLQQKNIANVIKAYAEARKHGVLAYSLGDENAVRGSCLSPHCLHAYQAYLAKEYGSISALNREWNSYYNHFSEITLTDVDDLPAADAKEWFRIFFAERMEMMRTDTEGPVTEEQIRLGNINDEIRSLQSGHFARWYDRQAFQDYNYVQLCKKYAEAFRKLDPLALTGFEGTDCFNIRRHPTRTRQGGDVDLFLRDLDYFVPYEGPANELIRSVARAEHLHGNWMGYDKDNDSILKSFWQQITHGMNTVQWWRWDNMGEYHGFLSQTLSPYPAIQDLLDDSRIIRDGLGTLLMHSEMLDDGVAMLYSLPSIYISHYDGNNAYGEVKRDHQLWFQLLHKAGVQFRYVTDRMLRLDEFDASRYKVLILPLAFAIGPKEAEVIRAFVRDGGTVIADLRPGVYDGHGKPLPAGVLDDVFGISHQGRSNATLIDRVRINGELDNHTLNMQWGNWHGKDIYPQMVVDPSVQLQGAQALGMSYYHHFWAVGTPACVVNPFGKGRAILLNFSLQFAPAEALFKNLLRLAGVRPRITLAAAGAGEAPDVEVTRWRNGQEEVLALLGAHNGPVQVMLDQPRRIYDLKAAECLGEVRSFVTDLKSNRAAFFAALSGAEEGVTLQARQKSVTAGNIARLVVQVPQAKGQRAVRIHLYSPNGERCNWFRCVKMVADQPIDVVVPFAFNDMKGAWNVKAVDLYTNRSATTALTVR